MIYYRREENSSLRRSDFDILQIDDPKILKSKLEKSYGIQAVVRKNRKLFLYHGTRIHIDYVDELGTFIEFEVPMAATKNAGDVVNILIQKFCINDSDFINKSYLDLMNLNNKREK
ncbi:MAG: class IV adenylate cyclase [Bacteroidota bacterium]|nr:class IV adenylate cyclase [Bacteroidota bacterium]